MCEIKERVIKNEYARLSGGRGERDNERQREREGEREIETGGERQRQ